MIILGLTGSIGMGKSATAGLFRDAGLPVYDADAAVHEIYEVGGSAVEPVGELFPGVVKDGRIDRAALREQVINHPEALKRLEQTVHPLVGESQMKFRQSALASGSDIAVLDIPLLFETGGDARVDHVVVVTAHPDEQRKRVLGRPGMTEDTFKVILGKQMPDAEKRARADFIINTRLDISMPEIRFLLLLRF